MGRLASGTRKARRPSWNEAARPTTNIPVFTAMPECRPCAARLARRAPAPTIPLLTNCSNAETNDGRSRPFRNIQPALHGGPGKAALQPRRYMLERIEFDEFPRAVKAVQVTHPAEHRDIGDGVFVIHDPLPAGKLDF